MTPICGTSCALQAEVVHLRREVQGLSEERDAANVHRNDLLALLDGKSLYVDCICPGCPRQVPEAWASGMCEPCATEDCEHTDGARAVAEELGESRKENAALDALLVERTAERDAAREVLAGFGVSLIKGETGIELHAPTGMPVRADRLRAVLAETPENIAAAAEASYFLPSWEGRMRAVLAALRAKAGLP